MKKGCKLSDWKRRTDRRLYQSDLFRDSGLVWEAFYEKTKDVEGEKSEVLFKDCAICASKKCACADDAWWI